MSKEFNGYTNQCFAARTKDKVLSVHFSPQMIEEEDYTEVTKMINEMASGKIYPDKLKSYVTSIAKGSNTDDIIKLIDSVAAGTGNAFDLVGRIVTLKQKVTSPTYRDSHFMEVLGEKTKVKLILNNYVNKTIVSFNLDYRDFLYLYHRAKIFHMPEPFYIQKDYAAFEKNSKQYCTISRSDTINDTKARNPWCVKITNVDEGKTKEGYIYLSDADFLQCMQSIQDAIDEFKIIKSDWFKFNFERWIDYTTRGQQKGQMEQTTGYDDTVLSEPENTNVPEATEKIYPLKVKLIGEWKENNTGKISCLCQSENGKEFDITFPVITPNILSAKENGDVIDINVKMSGKDVIEASKGEEAHIVPVQLVSDFFKTDQSWYCNCRIESGKEFSFKFLKVTEVLRTARENQTIIRLAVARHDGVFYASEVA